MIDRGQIDNELLRIARASERCDMCQLHEAREVLDQNHLAEMRSAAFAAKLRDRSRRRTISNLYMAVLFLALLVLYFFVGRK